MTTYSVLYVNTERGEIGSHDFEIDDFGSSEDILRVFDETYSDRGWEGLLAVPIDNDNLDGLPQDPAEG